MKRVIYTNVEQFLCDDDFIRYALDCTPDRNSDWATYLSAAPPIRSAYLKAYDILTHLDDCDYLTPEQTEQLKRRIFQSLHANVN